MCKNVFMWISFWPWKIYKSSFGDDCKHGGVRKVMLVFPTIKIPNKFFHLRFHGIRIGFQSDVMKQFEMGLIPRLKHIP